MLSLSLVEVMQRYEQTSNLGRNSRKRYKIILWTPELFADKERNQNNKKAVLSLLSELDNAGYRKL